MRRSIALLALVALPLAACDSSDSVDPKACSLNVSATAAGTSLLYTYTVNASDRGTVSGISYRSAAPISGSTGITTVASVTLPWTVTVTLPANIAPLLSVTGTVTSGTLTAKAEGRTSETAAVTVNASNSCSQDAS
ncbi:MAG: hypothetical protein LCH53_08505 [Bacteroidetes bacterium]|nr:hypothetical protein [Bacteroidota bacterium]